MISTEGFACVDIRKTYGPIVALDRVRFEVSPGCALAIVGPNGSGKTTLLHILTGFERPDRGHCFWNGREISRMAPHRIARLGIRRSFQEVRIIQSFSIHENVLLAAVRNRGEALSARLFSDLPDRADSLPLHLAHDLLDKSDLLTSPDRPARSLSYGQRKLLSLVCCLIGEPQVLILDEPVSGLAISLRNTVLNSLLLLVQAGMTLVFTEHDLSSVRKLATTVILLDRGRIVASGVPVSVIPRSGTDHD